MSSELKMKNENFEKILREVADSEGITDYEVKDQTNASGGDGFLSECHTGKIVDKKTGSKIQTFVKISLPKLGELTSSAYCNEYHFYTRIFPEFNKFQVEKPLKVPFQNVPKFYCGNVKDDVKYVALENLKIQNYVMTDKSQYVNEDHLKLLFEIYGKFHALSFAFKEHNFEKYSELTKPLKNLFDNSETEHIMVATKHTFDAAYNALKKINLEVSKKFDIINENFEKAYVSAAIYNGKYSGLLHGDCWSNNMLFKYGDNGKIEDLKIIDFQLSRDSTPVHDLSYFFYSGASKEDFNKLDKYLELYHKSFSTFAKELGSDPEKLFPLSVLKSEWKKYSLFGIFMGILLWQSKLLNNDVIEKFSSSNEEEHTGSFELSLQSEEYKKNTSNILLHAAEYGIV